MHFAWLTAQLHGSLCYHGESTRLLRRTAGSCGNISAPCGSMVTCAACAATQAHVSRTCVSGSTTSMAPLLTADGSLMCDLALTPAQEAARTCGRG